MHLVFLFFHLLYTSEYIQCEGDESMIILYFFRHGLASECKNLSYGDTSQWEYKWCKQTRNDIILNCGLDASFRIQSKMYKLRRAFSTASIVLRIVIRTSPLRRKLSHQKSANHWTWFCSNFIHRTFLAIYFPNTPTSFSNSQDTTSLKFYIWFLLFPSSTHSNLLAFIIIVSCIPTNEEREIYFKMDKRYSPYSRRYASELVLSFFF
jgi:hypothetical protein